MESPSTEAGMPATEAGTATQAGTTTRAGTVTDSEFGTTEVGRKFSPFEFSGTGQEYFGIWIVNLSLSIVTLGIYSAWAKVRTLRYFYGHTQLAGHGFDFLADPKRILVGRLIAVALLGAYTVCVNFYPQFAFAAITVIVLLIPAVLVLSSAFRARNSAYRNIRLHFRTDIGKAYRRALPPVLIALLIAAGIYALIPERFTDPDTGQELLRADLLISVMFFCFLPLLPWLDYIRTSFIIDHTQYGNLPGSFGASTWDFYKLYLKLLLAFVGIFMAMMVYIIAMAAGGGLFELSEAGDGVSAGAIFAVLLVLVPFYIALFFLLGWFGALRNNLIRNHTCFGTNAMRGTFKGRELGWISLSNIVATVLTLGMFIPWAAVRLARYNASHTAIQTVGLDDAAAVAGRDTSAIGEEVGAFFDIDIGL